MKTWNRVFTSAVFRLIVIVLAVVIPLNLLTLILGSTVISEVERQVSLETRNALQLYMSQIDDSLRRINIRMYMLAHSDTDFSYLNDKESAGIDEYYRQMQSVVSLGNTMNDILDDHTLIGGVYAWFPEKGYYVGQGGTTRQSEAVRGYIQEATGGQYEDYGAWSMVMTEDEAFLLLISSRRQAYYGAWVSLRTLADTMGLFDDGDSALQAFTDGAGTVYEASRDNVQTLDINASRQRYNGENCTLVKVASAYSDLYCVRVLSNGQITNSLPLAIRVLQILSVVSVLIIPVIVIAMRRWIVRPVGLLVGAMEKIEQGDVDYRIPDSSVGSEFDRINGHFNHMMDEVSELKISMYEQQLKSEKIRLGFLSRQIQPHFILNALNILYSYEPEEYQLSQKMILSLSKYFRYVVNANEDFVELGEELNHIRNYFEIQQARFLHAFHASVEYDGDLSGCLIPPLIVQSFAENAIKHAFVPGQVIEITVRAWREKDRLHVRVSDTGAGIPGEVLERIGEFRKNREFRMDLGVGIQNSIDRLEILYGGDAGLEISRQNPRGTRIDIELPIRQKEAADDERDPD